MFFEQHALESTCTLPCTAYLLKKAVFIGSQTIDEFGVNGLHGSGRLQDRRAQRGLADRQVDQRREAGQYDFGVPHPRIVAEARDRETAQPGAEEAADLVRKQRQAEERNAPESRGV